MKPFARVMLALTFAMALGGLINGYLALGRIHTADTRITQLQQDLRHAGRGAGR